MANVKISELPVATSVAATDSFPFVQGGVTKQVVRSILLEAVYPVGSLYINATDSSNPNTLFGFGTWVAFGAGRVPVGFDAGNSLFDSAEETGGSANAIVVSHTHTGTTDSAGAHSHTYSRGSISATMAIGVANTVLTVVTDNTSTAGAHTHSFTTDSSGSSGTNANYQPYITVYMWKRTA